MSLIKKLSTLLGISKAHSRARNTYKLLSKLSDYELRDIGICRGDIYRIANEGVRKEEAMANYEPSEHYFRGKSKPVATWGGKSHA